MTGRTHGKPSQTTIRKVFKHRHFTLTMGGGDFIGFFLRGLLAPYRKSISIRDVKFHNYNSDKSRDETKKQYATIFIWISRSTFIFV